jgi:hypothetical protein
MTALRPCHFESEVAADEPLYLPDQPSDQRTIAIAERGGRIIGGMLAEDSIAVTTIGLDPEVIESAAETVPRVPKALQMPCKRARMLHSEPLIPAQGVRPGNSSARCWRMAQYQPRSYSARRGSVVMRRQ